MWTNPPFDQSAGQPIGTLRTAQRPKGEGQGRPESIPALSYRKVHPGHGATAGFFVCGGETVVDEPTVRSIGRTADWNVTGLSLIHI